jgi:hypothetical protein
MKVWILFCLLALLIGASYVGYVGWNLTDVVAMPLTGYVAMGIGIIFTIIVGFTIVVVGGLMALMFYSAMVTTSRCPSRQAGPLSYRAHDYKLDDGAISRPRGDT